MYAILLLVFAVPLAAALQVEVRGVTPTQVLLYYVAPDEATCKVEVREMGTGAPLVPDTDPALFPRADLDVDRNILPPGSARLVRVGLRTSMRAANSRWYSRALAAETGYTALVNCGAQSGSATFTTLPPAGIAPEPLPTDPQAWGNLAMPEFDWNEPSRPVVDPRTGVRIYTGDPAEWSASLTFPFTRGWYQDGLGWTNPGDIASYGSAAASTSDVNAISVFVDTMQLNNGALSGGNWPYNNLLDIGVEVWGSGSDSSASNRTIEVALSLDSGQNAYTSWLPVTLPTSNAAAGTVPSNYPKAYFAGWGRILPRSAWPRRGYVTAKEGVVTLVKNYGGTPLGLINWEAGSYFDHDWPIGTRIYIEKSDPVCRGNLCTISSVQSATQLTLVESLTSEETPYRSAHLAVMIRKRSATGTVRVSARAQIAVGYPHDLWSGGCAAKPVKTTVNADGTPAGRTITGYPCIFPRTRQEAGALYFVGVSEPDLRLVSLLRHPTAYGVTLPGHEVQDMPSWPYVLLGPIVPSFDPDDPTVIYTTVPTQGGSVSLFRARYSGDWRSADGRYNSPWTTPPITSETLWTNMTKASEQRDIRSQILTAGNYDESKYGALAGLATAGISGKYALFTRSVGAQDSACWIFAFDARTGTLVHSWFTADGTGNTDLKYGGCHSVGPLEGGAFLVVNNGLKFRDARLYGGPFSAPVLAVKRKGEFDTSDTSLPLWPPTNAYDNGCPDDLSTKFKYAGAVDDQCVTILTREPCSAFAGPSERASSPCPWDAEKSMVAPLAEGDFLKDLAAIASFDSEGFQVVRKTDLGGGNIELVLLRNANYSYCAIGKDGVNMVSQFEHASGWSITAASQQQCSSNNMLVDIESNTVTSVNYNVTIGHFDVAPTGPGTDTWIGAGAGGMYRIMLNRKRSEVILGNDLVVPQWPKFAGFDGGGYSVHAGNVQSYVNVKQKDADPSLRAYAFDLRHYNGGRGIDFEWPGQTIGAPTNPVLQEGTSAVYKLSYTGVADARRGVLNVWAGQKVLIEKSSAEEGNTLTDADPWRFCFAFKNEECRSGSRAGDLFAVIPSADLKANCWASQSSERVPCAFAGPISAMQAMQLRIDQPDPEARAQRFLGTLLMGPPQQYVYSKVLPTPDASYLLFGGFLLHGYHTGLMRMKLPSFPQNDAKQSYLPVVVKGSGSSVFIEFGYEEYGRRTDFFCTARREACRVTAEEIDESNPFRFAHEPLSPVSSSYQIAIPVLPGHIVYYRVVDNGEPGPLQAATP